ncbi:MAG: succinate dehydrogenase (or fumarate reductase) cytochrome b subunit, b558 family [Planctomycetaceae bacterium]|nr:succinate dehydrogenase (or fumarate reductase) cytochrome b subunit, b558 family [Planctomycetaceae bacterium]
MNWVRQTLLRNWLVRAISTTIGQKLVMGATGLLLCGFLVAHLAGNLLIFQGTEHYNRYAKMLHENELLPVAEAGLLVLFVLHILLSFTTASANTAARPIGYYGKHSKLSGGTFVHAHNYMFLTGVLVLGFTLLHLSDMRFAHLNLRLKYDSTLDPAAHALHVLHDPISAPVYLLGSLVLGFHVSHGFQSAFKSLGLNHPKYTPFLSKLSILFGIAIGLGFASMPFWYYFAGH